MIANPWENPSIRILGYGYLDLDTILTIQHLGYLDISNYVVFGYLDISTFLYI